MPNEVETLLATTELSVDDLISALKERLHQAIHGQALRDALILKQQRDLQEAHHVIDQLRSAVVSPNGEGKVEAHEYEH